MKLVEPVETEPIAGGTNVPRWKVAVYSMVADIQTIYADTPEEAIYKVGEGFGRHAGVEGPTTIGMAATPFDSKAATQFIPQWMAQQQQLQQQLIKEQAEPKSRIVTPYE